MDTGFAPRPDGTYSVVLEGSVFYSPAFYSSLSFEYETESEEETINDDNLTTTLKSKVKSFSIDMDILGYHFIQGWDEFGVSASVEYLIFEAAEEQFFEAATGYEILSGSSTLNINNDRKLNVVLPTVDLRYEVHAGLFRIVVGGEYAPTVFVALDQSVETEPVYPGLPENGRISTSGNYFAYQSFSVNGEFEHQNSFLTPSFDFEYTHLPIEYEVAAVDGKKNIDTLIRELSVGGSIDISVIDVFGFSPAVKLRYDHSWTEIEGEKDVEMNEDWLFFFGFSHSR